MELIRKDTLIMAVADWKKNHAPKSDEELRMFREIVDEMLLLCDRQEVVEVNGKA